MAMDTHKKVLVVEDDESMREAIEGLLDAAGIEHLSYASAEALLAGHAIDDALCIISDIRLPALSGIDLLDALGARGNAPPVIVITAHDAPGVRDDAARHGAAAYLPKPFLGTALLAAITSVTHPAGLQ